VPHVLLEVPKVVRSVRKAELALAVELPGLHSTFVLGSIGENVAPETSNLIIGNVSYVRDLVVKTVLEIDYSSMVHLPVITPRSNEPT